MAELDIGIQNLSKTFGEKPVLQNLSLSFPEGRFTCIMGPSGSGKTTLLRILMGLEMPDEGVIAGMQGRRIAAVFQEDRLCEDFSAIANVRLACPRKTPETLVANHLQKAGLAGSLRQPVRQLSGGMKRRVAIVRAMLAPKDVLFLDEPLKGLDEGTRAAIAAYIRENASGLTTVMVTHDPAEVDMMGAGLFRLPLLAVPAS